MSLDSSRFTTSGLRAKELRVDGAEEASAEISGRIIAMISLCLAAGCDAQSAVKKHFGGTKNVLNTNETHS